MVLAAPYSKSVYSNEIENPCLSADFASKFPVIKPSNRKLASLPALHLSRTIFFIYATIYTRILDFQPSYSYRCLITSILHLLQDHPLAAVILLWFMKLGGTLLIKWCSSNGIYGCAVSSVACTLAHCQKES